mmetsp:Transcript_38118/g.98946  ORF Transcript_38118/g.98946 Transcript_38118/m.98946 type:complete len:256 (-) Transcript_38118:566-1333(-)
MGRHHRGRPPPVQRNHLAGVLVLRRRARGVDQALRQPARVLRRLRGRRGHDDVEAVVRVVVARVGVPALQRHARASGALDVAQVAAGGAGQARPQAEGDRRGEAEVQRERGGRREVARPGVPLRVRGVVWPRRRGAVGRAARLAGLSVRGWPPGRLALQNGLDLPGGHIHRLLLLLVRVAGRRDGRGDAQVERPLVVYLGHAGPVVPPLHGQHRPGPPLNLLLHVPLRQLLTHPGWSVIDGDLAGNLLHWLQVHR